MRCTVINILLSLIFSTAIDCYSQKTLSTDSTGRIIEGDKSDWNYDRKDYEKYIFDKVYFNEPHYKNEIYAISLELPSFQSSFELNTQGVLLKWSIGWLVGWEEINIERALSGDTNFQWIGNIDAIDSRDIIDYQFLDRDVEDHKFYDYRLVIAGEGHEMRQNILYKVYIKPTLRTELYQVFTNPANGEFEVSFFLAEKDIVTLYFKKGDRKYYLLNQEPEEQGFYKIKIDKHKTGFDPGVMKLYMECEKNKIDNHNKHHHDHSNVSVKYSDNFKIEISKQTFKLYEPIIVLSAYKNKSEQNDSLFGLFSPYQDKLNYIIEDDLGNIYSDNKIPIHPTILHPAPQIIKSNDSDKVSFSINNYGLSNEEKNVKNYFGNYGYLPVGHYKVFSTIELNNGNSEEMIKSNEVDFNVIDLNNEDHKILNLEFKNKYSEIISMYPDNVLTEHIYVKFLNEKFPINNEKNFNFTYNEIIDMYDKFFRKYPHSYYNYNYDCVFIDLFFTKLGMKSDNTLRDIELLKSKYQGTTLSEYLSNKISSDRIVEIVKNQKEHYIND